MAIGADQFAEAVAAARDPVWVIEYDVGSPESRKIVYVNRAFEDLYACTGDEVFGTSSHEFFAPRNVEWDPDAINASLAAGTQFEQRWVQRQDDLDRALNMQYIPIPRDGTLRRWIVVAHDVTETLRLQRQALRLSSALEHASDLIAIFNRIGDDWILDYVNEAFVRAVGYERHELIGRTTDHMQAPELDLRRFNKARQAMLDGIRIKDEVIFVAKGGRHITFEFSAQMMKTRASTDPPSCVVVYRDVTLQRHDEQTLQRAADRDELTGLSSRRFFEHALGTCADLVRSSAGNQMHAMLFIDLDGFKAVNDRLGHEAGDGVLLHVAQVLQGCVLGSDVLARWGGDEFAALLYNCDAGGAEHVGQRMLRALKQSPPPNVAAGIGASIGVSFVGRDPTETQRRADAACYDAKRRGKNAVSVL